MANKNRNRARNSATRPLAAPTLHRLASANRDRFTSTPSRPVTAPMSRWPRKIRARAEIPHDRGLRQPPAQDHPHPERLEQFVQRARHTTRRARNHTLSDQILQHRPSGPALHRASPPSPPILAELVDPSSVEFGQLDLRGVQSTAHLTHGLQHVPDRARRVTPSHKSRPKPLHERCQTPGRREPAMTNAPIRGTLPPDRNHPACDYADIIIGSRTQPASSSGHGQRQGPNRTSA